MFSVTLLTLVLLATTALARPSGLSGRFASRGAGHQSKPITHPEITTTNASQVDSENWAGAVYNNYPSGSFTSVTGTFTVPTPSVPSGGSGSYYLASAWVGIDGDTCNSAILQTGVDFVINDGSVSYNAWYEWWPAPPYGFSGDISFSAGDSVQLTVTATSTTSGTAVIENLSTGQTVTQDVTSSHALCQQDAEWIVEDNEDGNSGSLVPFADFGTVTFTGASATTGSGSIGPGDAALWYIEQNGEVLTSVSVSGSDITINYIG